MNVCTPVTACRSCADADLRPILSLGSTPLANSLIAPDQREAPIPTYPLDLVRCRRCTLVQLGQVVDPSALFGEYVYFSSFSDTMLRHGSQLADRLVEAECLTERSLVIEIASNDGYLLRFFKERGVGVLGIEPAANIAAVAERERGIPTMVEFFDRELGQRLASEGRRPDVVIGNNVLAHVPDLNSFAEGIRLLLGDAGLALFEFPYLKDMLDGVEFDTIYHEHGCYLSLTTVADLFARHGLTVFDVERTSIHGGSLRIAAAPRESRPTTPRLRALLDEEKAWGVDRDEPYAGFVRAVERTRRDLRELVESLKGSGASIAAYGAAAKGVTLLSYSGIDEGHLDFVVDRSPHKQGKLYPVGRLPILAPEALLERQPDAAILLTWNFAAEIIEQQSAYLAAGGRFVIPIPRPRVVDR